MPARLRHLHNSAPISYPIRVQPVLDREKLRSWLRQFHIGSLLNTPFSSGCIGEVCGWTAERYRDFIREVQIEAQKEGLPPLLYGCFTPATLRNSHLYQQTRLRVLSSPSAKPNRPRAARSYGLDSVHGAGYILGAIILPHQLSIGATFSRKLAADFGRIGAKDTLAAGVPWLFSPILGLGTNPLWPRLYETFGAHIQPHRHVYTSWTRRYHRG